MARATRNLDKNKSSSSYEALLASVPPVRPTRLIDTSCYALDKIMENRDGDEMRRISKQSTYVRIGTLRKKGPLDNLSAHKRKIGFPQAGKSVRRPGVLRGSTRFEGKGRRSFVCFKAHAFLTNDFSLLFAVPYYDF